MPWFQSPRVWLRQRCAHIHFPPVSVHPSISPRVSNVASPRFPPRARPLGFRGPQFENLRFTQIKFLQERAHTQMKLYSTKFPTAFSGTISPRAPRSCSGLSSPAGPTVTSRDAGPVGREDSSPYCLPRELSPGRPMASQLLGGQKKALAR